MSNFGGGFRPAHGPRAGFNFKGLTTGASRLGTQIHPVAPMHTPHVKTFHGTHASLGAVRSG